MINILWRNIKWRFQNPVSVIITILQPMIWLLLYSSIAGQSSPNKAAGNYTAFILPGIMVLVIFSCSASSGFINYIMKSKGSFNRILIAPISRSSIVCGQLLEAVLLSFIEIIFLFILSIFLSVHLSLSFSNFLLIVILLFLTAFFMAGLSYSVSLWLPNEIIYETVMNTIILPVFFMSTALFPLENLSGILKTLVMLNPFTHIINNLRSLLFGESIIFENILPVIILFLVLCFGSFTLGVKSLKKENNQ